MSRVPAYMLVFVLGLVGCKVNEPPVQIDPPDEGPTAEVVWQIRLRSDSLYSFSTDVVQYNNVLMTSAEPYGSLLGSVILTVDTSGELVWTTDDIGEICSSINHLDGNGAFIDNGILVYLCKSRPAALDLNSGVALWDYSTETGTSRVIQQMGNKAFTTQEFSGIGIPYDSSRLFMLDNLTGTRRELFRVGIEEDFYPILYPPAIHVSDAGDTLLFFQNRQWNFVNSSEGGRVDLYCLNMTHDTIVWKAIQIDPYGNSSACLPLYYDGKVYFRGFQTLHCLDAMTGEQLWMHEFPGDLDHLQLGNTLIAEGKLVVKSSSEGIHAFDPNTGELLWERYDAGNTSCYMTYFDGSVYYGNYDGRLFNVRVSDGEILWAMDSPNKGKNPSWDAQFENGVKIDENNRRIFTTDGYYLICLQL